MDKFRSRTEGFQLKFSKFFPDFPAKAADETKRDDDF